MLGSVTRPSPNRLVPAAALAAILLAVVGTPRPARADCEVVPGEEGQVSTWLVAGPFATPVRAGRSLGDELGAAPAGVDPAALAPAASAPVGQGRRWTAVAAPAARLDVDPARNGGGRTWFVGAVLDAAAETRGYLFLGANDGVAVWLDGREVYRRGAPRPARDDDDAVPLTLAPGRHRLVLRLLVAGGPVRLYARWVGQDFAPAAGARLTLPGVDDATCGALGATALHTEVRREVVAAGVRVRLEASYPGGTARLPSETSRRLRVRVPGLDVAPTVDLALDGVAALPAQAEATLPAPTGTLTVESVAADGSTHPVREVVVRVPPAVQQALLRATQVLGPLSEDAPPAGVPREALTSVKYIAERLADLVADADGDASHLADEARSLDELVDAVAAGRDPYEGRHGPMRRAYRSEIDGTLQGYSIYVPPSYRGDRPFPLVVALHGLGGSAHRMLAVIFGFYNEDEPRGHADRHLPPLPDGHAIVVAPYGFGDAHYRGPGEDDVMRVIDEVRRAYRIDPDRTYMTGLSMGGIGAASIPFRHPDLFAMAAPLCGYHSYFVRNDTRGLRRPWELFLMESRSNASWAENGLHLPLYIVHGTRDQPTANSGVLVDRYRQLGYSIEVEWPDLGHNVWEHTYENGRIFPYFLRRRRDPSPRHVRFRTPSLRWRRSYWVSVDALRARDRWGEVDATLQGGSLRVTTGGVAALTLAPPAELFPAGTAHAALEIDGQSLALTPGQPASFVRAADGRWAAGHAPPESSPGGPVRDVFGEPIAVVYGTRDAGERALNLRVARAWARMRPGVRAHIPVVTDDEVTEAFARSHNLVLVGTPAGNSYLARVQDRLPIRAEPGAITAGGARYAGAEVGATFAYPNPEAPARTLLVVTGATPLGVWRSRFLPDLVPDFVIYDEHLAPARGRIILGSPATVLAAGFFTPDGAVPPDPRDPHAATPPPATTDEAAPEENNSN